MSSVHVSALHPYAGNIDFAVALARGLYNSVNTEPVSYAGSKAGVPKAAQGFPKTLQPVNL